MGYYKTRREYLIAAIRGAQTMVDNERASEGVRKESRKIHARLCGQLDDLDLSFLKIPKTEKEK